jgi:ketosteroid isomerase-like protein
MVTLEELEKEIRALEAREEIKQLHRDYAFWLTNKQYDEIMTCFAENAIAKIRTPEVHKGKLEIEKRFREDIAKRPTPKGGHMLIQPVITVDGDTARGYWTMLHFFYDTDTPGSPIRWKQGRYDCEYIREDGKWKFSSLYWAAPWPEHSEQWVPKE